VKLRITKHGIAGTGHPESEDVFAVTPLAGGGALCVLSDGVGSARDPRRCAERVVRLVSENFAARPRDWSIQKTFDRLAEQAGSSLYAEGAYHDGAASMQATLAAVSLSDCRLCGTNIGDSPVYLLRDGAIRQLSQTHRVFNSDGHDVLTAAIGMGDAPPGHYFDEPIEEGDMLVITSDGLTHLLDEASILEHARKFRSARSLLETALEKNTAPHHDDLSAILVEVEEVGPCPVTARDFPFPHPSRNTLIDDYLLLRSIAGNERVWLAEKEDRRFVLKFIPQEATTDDSGVIAARFAREAWNAARFESDHLVRSRLPESGSPHYYVMDYIEAPSLRFVLKSRHLRIDEAVGLGRFLCHAGQWLLRHEMVHGDIKPDNVVALPPGGPVDFKLLDLGLAAPIFTDSGVSGTPTYLAPERFTGAALTERTEIYSIGATLYEMLTGRPPHGQIERFQTPTFRSVQRPSLLNANVPPWLDMIILKCLSQRQSLRFQAFSELLYALEHPASVATGSYQEPLLSRNPLRFYQVGFWLLLLTTLFLLLKLFATP
jgi:serine/threonine protein kinase